MAPDIVANGHADDCAFFNLGGIGMSKIRKGGPCNLLTAAKHNKRELQAEIGYDMKINPALIANNRCLAGAADAAGVVALAADAARSAGVQVSKLKKDTCQALEVIFGLPRDSGVDETAYFAQCLRWAGQAFAGLVILSADVHADEEKPHMHILFSPFKDGASVSKAAQSKKTKLELGKAFFDAVAGPAGFKRAQAKLHGQVKAAAVRAVVKALEAVGAASLPTWKLTLKDVERNTLQYLRCLDIDPQSLMADVKARAYDLESTGTRSYDLREPVDNLGQIMQGHINDDLGELNAVKQSNAGTQTAPAEHTPVALVRTSDAATRRHIAKVAEADARAKHAIRSPAPAPTNHDRSTRRVRDADFDVTAWRAA